MVSTVWETQRELPVLLECEVAVVGGGPGGLAAAIGAAMAGADTALIEQYGCLGGGITLCGGSSPKVGDRVGVAGELLARMARLNALEETGEGPVWDTEVFKYMADGLVKDFGIAPLYHCLGAAPYLVDGAVCGVITESKSGRCVVLAKRVVDCTGEGDLALGAGAALEGGLSRMILPFAATGVKTAGLPARGTGEGFRYTHITGRDVGIAPAASATVLDSRDILAASSAQRRMRKEALALLAREKEREPAGPFGEAKLRNYAMAPGMSGGKRVVGMDIQEIVCSYGPGIPVPFGTLTVQGAKNLLCAGRCTAGPEAAGRVDYGAMTGQAAGVASALSLGQNTESAAVSVASVVQELARQARELERRRSQ